LLQDHDSLVEGQRLGLPVMGTHGLVTVEGMPLGPQPGLLLQRINNMPLFESGSRLPYNLRTIDQEVWSGRSSVDQYPGFDRRARPNIELAYQTIKDKSLGLSNVNFLIDGVSGKAFMTPPVNIYMGNSPLVEEMRAVNLYQIHVFSRMAEFNIIPK